MLLRPEYLSQKLDQPLPTKDGGTLRTIRDACDYMTGMDKKRSGLTGRGLPSATKRMIAHHANGSVPTRHGHATGQDLPRRNGCEAS